MPPPVKHDVGIVFFDLYSKEDLLGCLLKFVGWEAINTKDEHRLFLANSQETCNAKDLPNLELVPKSLGQLGVKEVQSCVQQAKQAEKSALDLFQMFSLAIYHLREFQDVPGVTTKQIILFSNLLNVSPLEQPLFQQLVDKIAKYDIYVYIVGPEVDFLEPICGDSFFYEGYKEKIVLRNPSPGAEQAMKLVCEVNGVIADASVGIHLLVTYRKTAGSQPWKVPLTIGTNIEIPVITTKVYRKDVHITVKQEKITADDVSVIVDVEETVRGLSVHNKFVEVRNDNEIFQIDTETTFDLICFTAEEITGDESFVVLAERTCSSKQQQFFDALVHVLAEQKKVAIVSRVYKEKTQPKYFVLIPMPNQVPKRFSMVELCTGEEVENVVKFRCADKPKSEVDPDIREFINSMDVTNPDGVKKVAIEPTMMMAWCDSKV
nr:unnamed protein product [Callosobruchus analis]